MNDLPRDYYVYCLDDENGEPFYVGCTNSEKRYSDHLKYARNQLSRNVQTEKNKTIIRMLDAGQKPGFRKIALGLTIDDGYALERETIARIGRLLLGTGPLTNIHGGGDKSKPDEGVALRRRKRAESEAPARAGAREEKAIAKAARMEAALARRAEAAASAAAMARQLKRLTARTVAAMTKPGRHADGGNLYLTITSTPGGVSKRWTFLYKLNGRQREAGFGPSAGVTLAEARDKAAGYRFLLAKGVDPLDAKKAAQKAAAARKTFGQCADELIKSKRREWRSEVHAGQWRTTIDSYCRPIHDVPVDLIDTAAVLSILQPIWARIPETASRVRGRIEAVIDYAKANSLRSGENPAAWRGHLALILPKRQKLSRGHHAAMPYAEVPAFVGKLREAESIPALALEFLILTAARSGEVLGARWDEINMDAKIWTLEASRMKACREHRVPLSARATVILEQMASIKTGDLIFAGQRRRRPLAGATLAALVPGATVHGFRSAFRDWAGEETSFPREIAEQALAHATGGAVEQAYRRGDALEKRRRLMEVWSNYCEPVAAGKVVPIRAAQ
jgi:integrase